MKSKAENERLAAERRAAMKSSAVSQRYGTVKVTLPHSPKPTPFVKLDLAEVEARLLARLGSKFRVVE